MIVLTKAQADAVRGESEPYHRIEPRQLDQTPRYIVGEQVLDDPRHATKRSTLAGATRRQLTPQEKASLEVEDAAERAK